MKNPVDTCPVLEDTVTQNRWNSAARVSEYPHNFSRNGCGAPALEHANSAQLIRELLRRIGEDPDREGLKETPTRVIRSWKELFSGYHQRAEDVLVTQFHAEEYDEMVLLRDIEFYSTCEHHMLPFCGKAHVAYIPENKIVGLSKLARLVDVFARRLQVQERLTQQVASELQRVLKPKGVAVMSKRTISACPAVACASRAGKPSPVAWPVHSKTTSPVEPNFCR